jgi:hypothetical protein
VPALDEAGNTVMATDEDGKPLKDDSASQCR